MHDVMERGLEEYLRGGVSREVESHLAGCEQCRAEVKHVQELSGLFGELRAGMEVTPSVGFSQRLMRRVREEQKQSFWSVFRVDPGFARKLVLASLLSLVALGGYLASAPAVPAGMDATAPEAVLGSHDTRSADPQVHQDGMLVTLATYHQ